MRTPIILLALALAACTTQNNSALVITKVVPPKADATTTPPSCIFDSGSDELTFLKVNLSENEGNVAAVVENFITNTAATSNPQLGLDGSRFLPHQAVVTYEFPANANGAPPAGVTVPSPAIIPVGGLSVAAGETATMGVPMFPTGAIGGAAGIADGTFIRVTFHIEGKLLSGNTTHTSEREYLFEVCTAANCAGNVCL
jgi:hypothetical protein